MQRTNPLRAALVFTVLTLVVITALCAVFLLADWPLPDWLILVGRWIPALASLLVMRLLPLPGGIATWWSLRPGGWRRFLLGSGVAVGALLGAYIVTVLIAALIGVAAPLPSEELLPILLILIPVIIVYSLSTFGEEAAWRGYLQQLLSQWGFWRSSSAVAGIWVIFHVPLHGTYILQDALPAEILLSGTLLLFPLGLFLSAAVVRFGSVWPAVFAHGVPLSALNLVRDPDLLTSAQLWALTALSALVLVAAATLLAPRRIRQIPPGVLPATVAGDPTHR